MSEQKYGPVGYVDPENNDFRTVYYQRDGMYRWADPIEPGRMTSAWNSSTTPPPGFKAYQGDEEHETRTVSSTGAVKGVKLARFDLLPPAAMYALAEHYGKGAEKYGDSNWEKGYEWSKSYQALQRHAWKFWSGEDIDPETGTHHMAAVAFHALALLEYHQTHPEFDDRKAVQ